ncbi:MAG: hypothetical protein WBN39_10780 [Flavobacteriaceae bacterium]
MITIGKRYIVLLGVAAIAVTLLFAACSNSEPVVPLAPVANPGSTPKDNGVVPPTPEFRFLRSLAYRDGDGSQRRSFGYSGGTMVREDFVFQGLQVWSSQFEYNAENKLLEEFICATGDVTNDSGIDFKCARISEKRFYDYTLGKLDHHGTEKLDEQGNVIFNESVTVNQDDRGNIISELYNNGPDTSQNHTYIYTDQDNIRKKRVAYLPGNTTEDITFEVDDGVNPFFPLWKTYGYYREPANDKTVLSPMFSPQNVTRVYVNNILKLEVDYTYDAKGYPLTASIKRYVSGSSFIEGDITYTYAN